MGSPLDDETRRADNGENTAYVLFVFNRQIMKVHSTRSIDLIREALERRSSVSIETVSLQVYVQDDQRPDPLRTAVLCWSIDRGR